VKSETDMDDRSFRGVLHEYLRKSGHYQNELASTIGLHPKVLSRKVRSYGDAFLSHEDLQAIIKILAEWHTITTREEAYHLLELAGAKPTIFDDDQWQKPPLSKLTVQQRAFPALKHNLPAPRASFIGRAWAIERLLNLLDRPEVRLITLIGTGGSGKTHLALHVARQVVSKFEHGVWLVTLDRARDPALVPISIAQALNIQLPPGLAPLQGLIAYLRDKQLLLLLDSFEQVGDAANDIDELLAAAPGLKVLVTSRSVLHLLGEHLLSVPPLEVPNSSIAMDKTGLLQLEAVQLFVERAQAGAPSFRIADENAAIVGQICEKVDGLPLALELAAARIKSLSPASLLERLSQARFSMLSGGARNLPDRQKTLHNTITWSYELLSPEEQAWFRRLGVFQGNWSLEAAEALERSAAAGNDSATADLSPLDVLEQLADQSLLIRLVGDDTQIRFGMLDTIREYALEQMVKQEECIWLRDWHACYYLRLAEAAEIGLRGPQQLAWLDRLVADGSNLRAALEWSLQQAKEGETIHTLSIFQQPIPVAGSSTLSAQRPAHAPLLAIEVCLRLAAALQFYWEWRGSLAEGRYWLGEALALPLENGACATILAARAKALSEDSRLVCLQNDQTRAAELAEESIALWQQLEDAPGLVTAMIQRGWAALGGNELDKAKSVLREGMQHISVEDEPWLYAQLLFYLAAASGFSFEFSQMNACYEQSKALFEQAGDKIALADLMKDWGGMSIIEGNPPQAIRRLLASIRLCYELRHKQFIATGTGSLSYALGLNQKPDPAQASIDSAQIGGASESLSDSIGLTPWTRSNPMAQAARTFIRSQVDEETYTAAWAAGRKLSIEQTIELALQLGERALS
jgi:predicted ATPase